MFPIRSGGSKGGSRDVCPPWGPKFFQFHAVFGKIWQNRMLVPPLGTWQPLLGEILDPPLISDVNISQRTQFILMEKSVPVD